MSEISFWDLFIVGLYFVAIIFLAVYYYKKAKNDTKVFFLSGRNMPWYLAGTAMVATTFAADTPLAVTELVARNGIAGNWLWWNMAIGGLLTVFFFAKLWRRAEIMTDVEFVELRYDGKSAAFLRGFKALYLGLFMNAIILAWVNKAMEKIFSETIPGCDPFILTLILATIVAFYASLTGLLGSARIDSLQFVIAMIGCIILAVIAINLPEVGGISGLKEKLPSETFNFFPKISFGEIISSGGQTMSLSLLAFIAYIGLQWWSSWYPGADPGGGGYIAQRIMSAKDEKNSLLSALWFNIAHYCLRPWPWIIAALAAVAIYPRFSPNAFDQKELNDYKIAYQKFIQIEKNNLPAESLVEDEQEMPKVNRFYNKAFKEQFENTIDPGKLYPKIMKDHLPRGLFGLLLAVFIAAYMSTISSQLNWGTSYIVNDFYKRFISKNSSESHYILISRITIIVLTILSLIISKYFLTAISGAWEFIINASAGIGLVLILRWYWHRINAQAEIAAMIAPLIVYPIIKINFDLNPPLSLFPTVAISTLIWISVMFITKPVEEKKLIEFYKKVKPFGIGWRKFAIILPEVKIEDKPSLLFLAWILSTAFVYCCLYLIGKIIFWELNEASISLGLAFLIGYPLTILIKKIANK